MSSDCSSTAQEFSTTNTEIKKKQSSKLKTKPNLCWYACYGSNLRLSRFLTYIQGGQPEGSLRVEIGCTDTTPPQKITKHKISAKLYFAKESVRWNGGGVCFLHFSNTEEQTQVSCERSSSGNNSTITTCTEQCVQEEVLLRLYLITQEQFVEVVAQENGMTTPKKIAKLRKEFKKEVAPYLKLQPEHPAMVKWKSLNGWYDALAQLGELEGHPIYTFTTSRAEFLNEQRKPSIEYLHTIIAGLFESEHVVSVEDCAAYFSQRTALRHHMTAEELKSAAEVFLLQQAMKQKQGQETTTIINSQ